jgi:adenylylsulfate kinase-like enzyme
VSPYACAMVVRGAEGVLITGVYGSGKSSVAAEIAYLLEQSRQPYALLDLDFLGWGVDYSGDDMAGFRLMLRNLAAVVSNYREAGISVFLLAYFVSAGTSCGVSGRLSECRCGWFACRCRCPTSNGAWRPT